MKVIIWTNMPNHYQADFHEALRKIGIDLLVCYYSTVPHSRQMLGWSSGSDLPAGEQFVPASLKALEAVPDWRERVHIVPGYGEEFTRSLVRVLVSNSVSWVHWSEPSHTGLRWWLSLPRKLWYARLVNEHALGAFGQGVLALQDFSRWGIDPAKQAVLTYSPRGLNAVVEADQHCIGFKGHRRAFVLLGAMCHRKGIDVLLKAFASLDKGSENWVLFLVGTGKSELEYRHLASHLKVDQRVFFRGSVCTDQIASILVAADVLVLPSRFDGWGVVLNEAASVGMPLIASENVGAAWHLIAPSLSGYRVRPKCTDSLKRAMMSYVDNPELVTGHGAYSVQLFQNYTPEANANRFVQALLGWKATA